MQFVRDTKMYKFTYLKRQDFITRTPHNVPLIGKPLALPQTSSHYTIAPGACVFLCPPQSDIEEGR